MPKRPYSAPKICNATAIPWPQWVWRVYSALSADDSKWLRLQVPRPTFALQAWTDRPPEPGPDGVERQRHESTAAALQRWCESQQAQERARAAQEETGRGRFYRRPSEPTGRSRPAQRATGQKKGPGKFRRGRKGQQGLF